MRTTSHRLPRASAMAMALMLGQPLLVSTAIAQEPPAAPTRAAPAAPAPQTQSAAPQQTPADAERAKRYEELRVKAAEFGMELPVTPPPAGFAPDDRASWRGMTPEERRALWDQRWEQRRKDAAARGIDLPETPPWVEAEKRREAMRERFEQYRKTIEQMSKEQREAAQAVFGRRMPPPPPMDLGGMDDSPWNWESHCHPSRRGFPGYPPAMPDYAPGSPDAPPPDASAP